MEPISSSRRLIAEIEHEHAALLQHLERLHALLPCPGGTTDCGPCGADRAQACQDEVDGFYLDLVNFMLEHFTHEDRIMRRAEPVSGLREAFAMHSEDHAVMMERIAAAVGSAMPVDDKLSLMQVVRNWLHEHISHHDALLLHWLHGQEA